MPKRKGLAATTMVRVATGFCPRSMCFARILAWLLSQTWAMNTASRPKTTAKPIMTKVLARTAVCPV